MHCSLVAKGLLVAGFFGGSQVACAQYSLVGQTGSGYVDIIPDLVLTAQAIAPPASGGESKVQELDLDQDGQNDIRISASGNTTAGSFYSSHGAAITLLHNNAAAYATQGSGVAGPVVIALADADTVQATMRKRTLRGELGLWSNYGPYISYPLHLVGVGGTGAYSGGEWGDNQVHYLGLRLRATATGPWRYGWLRAHVTHSANPVSLLVADYALATNAVLLTTQALQAAGWQLYPTHVTNQFTIEPPSPASRGQVTVRDLCGRLLAEATLNGHPQQLALTGLAAGVYIVQLETSTGRFTQRVSKL